MQNIIRHPRFDSEAYDRDERSGQLRLFSRRARDQDMPVQARLFRAVDYIEGEINSINDINASSKFAGTDKEDRGGWCGPSRAVLVETRELLVQALETLPLPGPTVHDRKFRPELFDDDEEADD